MLQTDYSISKRTDFYLEGVYQNVQVRLRTTVLSHAMINTLSPSATNTQVAVTVGMRHALKQVGVWSNVEDVCWFLQGMRLHASVICSGYSDLRETQQSLFELTH